MARFAVIRDGVVVNVLIADSKESAESVTTLECVETDIGNVGDSYIDGDFIDQKNGIFPEENPEIIAEQDKMLNNLTLTAEEQLKLDNFLEEILAAREAE